MRTRFELERPFSFCGVLAAAALACVAAPVVATAACVCLNNASVIDLDASTGGDDGQFSEQVIVNAPNGQTWTVTQATGAFDAFNVPAVGMRSPLVPIATDGSVKMVPNGANRYTIDFVHVDAIAYSITVNNGLGTQLTIGNTCRYPNPVFAPPIESTYHVATDPPVTLGAGVSSGPPLANAAFTVDGSPATQIVPQDLAPRPTIHVVELTATGTVGPNDFQACVQGVRKRFAVAASASVPAMGTLAASALLTALLGLGLWALRRA